MRKTTQLLTIFPKNSQKLFYKLHFSKQCSKIIAIHAIVLDTTVPHAYKGRFIMQSILSVFYRLFRTLDKWI